MHYSAKRGVAIACHLSVCLSVYLSVTSVDQNHIGWKSCKLIARTISPTPSLFVAQTPCSDTSLERKQTNIRGAWFSEEFDVRSQHGIVQAGWSQVVTQVGGF